METLKKSRGRFGIQIVLVSLLLLFVFVSSFGLYTFNGEGMSFTVPSLQMNDHGTNIFSLLSSFAVFVSIIIFSISKNKNAVNVGVLLVFLALISFIIKPDVYLLQNFNDQYGDLETKLGVINIISLVLISMAAFTALSYALDFDRVAIRDMVEIAILVALAIVFDLPFLKIKMGANGGSISFEMVPLIILALRHGPIKGFLANGIIYGFLSCILGGYGLAYFPFDYLLAFGSLALIGVFRSLIFKKDQKPGYKIIPMVILAVSIILSVTLKLFFHTISGVVFWNTPFVASIIYNLLPNLVSGLISVATVLALYGPLTRMRKPVIA